MNKSYLLFSGICVLHIVTWQHIRAQGVSCMTCSDVASPTDCRERVECGDGEICYTREFTDNHGLHGFRMGCEDENDCQVLINAHLLIGRRSMRGTGPAPPIKCFNCCASDDCNANLCLDAVTGHTVTTSQPHVTHTRECPPEFLVFRDRCYFISNWTLQWEMASDYCKSRGAQLMSDNSQEEQNFIAKHLSNHIFYWIGGYYSETAGRWQWVDGSTMVYTHWHGNEPTHETDEYRFGITGAYRWDWGAEVHTRSAHFICEKIM